MPTSIEVVFTEQAEAQLRALAQWLYDQQLSGDFVVRYLEALQHGVIEVLKLFPEAGRRVEAHPPVRRLVFQDYSFYYVVHDDKVAIVDIVRENLPNLH